MNRSLSFAFGAPLFLTSFLTLLMANIALAASVPAPTEINQSVQLDAPQVIAIMSQLRSIGQSERVNCYRNLTSYRDKGIELRALVNDQTWVDQNSKHLYNRGHLAMTFPAYGDHPQFSMTKTAANEYSVQYERMFYAFVRNQAFTDIQFGHTSDATVKHFFKIENNQYVYLRTNYDLVRREGFTMINTPHVRCGAILTVQEPGLLWGTNPVNQTVPPDDLKLKAEPCLTQKEKCAAVAREPYIIR